MLNEKVEDSSPVIQHVENVVIHGMSVTLSFETQGSWRIIASEQEAMAPNFSFCFYKILCT
jgi:hypothetical protein